MRFLSILLFLSFVFAGELEVDGDLNVTGTIESQTIESLKTQIEALESQNSQKSFEKSIFSKKIRRNSPCPCGSGKKFKHCHGAI